MYGINEMTKSNLATAASKASVSLTSNEMACALSPANSLALDNVLQATVTSMLGSWDKMSTVGLATKPEPNNKTFLAKVLVSSQQ